MPWRAIYPRCDERCSACGFGQQCDLTPTAKRNAVFSQCKRSLLALNGPAIRTDECQALGVKQALARRAGVVLRTTMRHPHHAPCHDTAAAASCYRFARAVFARPGLL